MPMGRPRPRLNLANTSITDGLSREISQAGPSVPSTPNSSQLPYPHQSSPSSGTSTLEPDLNDHPPSRISHAEGIRLEWERRPMNRGYPIIMDEQEVSQQMVPSETIGPWDSASQRSLPYHTPFPMHQPMHVPLEASSTHYFRNQQSCTGLSYIDEEEAYYKSDANRPASTFIPANEDVEMRRWVGETDPMGEGDDSHRGLKYTEFDSSPYPHAEPKGFDRKVAPPSHFQSWVLFPTGLDRVMALLGLNAGKCPVEQAVERKRRGLGGQRYPLAAWSLAVAMTAVMVYELAANHNAMGSPIAIHPNFNYMIGPSAEVLIDIGARFPPCMKDVSELPPTFQLACLNDTSNPPTSTCSIQEICGHGGFHGQPPNQAWRFVVPIFLHVGIIHLALNMVAQVIAGAQVEREMGTIPFLLVYFAGGIYGFILGGNFARPGIPSVGASGALFATNACILVDLLLHWRYEDRPKLKAFLLVLEFLVGIAIGYIPNAVDGLAHLGGFAMGLLLGTILYPSISETKRHRYIVWICRIVALPLIVMAFVLTIRNFYTADPNASCEWCRYLSCIPTAANNHCTGTGITVTNVTTTRRSWDSL